MKLGNMEDARLIHRRRKKDAGPIPKGWRLVGKGAYRTCYLSPDGVVYKLNRPNAHNEDANCNEFENYKWIKSKGRKMPNGWRVAPTKLYSFEDNEEQINVVAMKYVSGKHEKLEHWSFQQVTDYWDRNGAANAFDSVCLYDLHEGNYIVTPKGTKVIIDLGE